MTDYATRLHDSIRQKQNPVCVGLDPRWEQLPQVFRSGTDATPGNISLQAEAYCEFCCRIIDVVSPLVPVVKPQAAFFEELGPAGCAALGAVIGHAREKGLLVICDAKRGDIGSTAEAYARGYLAGADPTAANWAADALTVNPYMGDDTLQPFVNVARERGAGLYVLVRTSNSGSAKFQNRKTEGETLYESVACVVEALSVACCPDQTYGPIGAVVGATYPEELAQLRRAMPHVPLLVPGYGSQGGTSADVAAAFDEVGLGAVVNSSRGIIFAHAREPYASRFGPDRWEEAVAAATQDMIADLHEHTPAGKLRK